MLPTALSTVMLAAALLAGSTPTPLASEWGKKVLNAGRYIWAGVVTASGAACCIGGGPACLPCAGAAGAAILYGDDKLSGYCE